MAAVTALPDVYWQYTHIERKNHKSVKRTQRIKAYLKYIANSLMIVSNFVASKNHMCSEPNSIFPKLMSLWCTISVTLFKNYNCIKVIIQFLFLNINQLDALNFIISLFQASTFFEHTCSSSGGQNCIIQSLVSPHTVGAMIPQTA
jgi:hypothetical protein